MIIKTAGQLKKLLQKVDDDFAIDLNFYELIENWNGFPYKRIKCNLEFDDMGYSEKTICFGAYMKEK
jgi:hypothetical protein